MTITWTGVEGREVTNTYLVWLEAATVACPRAAAAAKLDAALTVKVLRVPAKAKFPPAVVDKDTDEDIDAVVPWARARVTDACMAGPKNPNSCL